jgi:hypothetical protein
MLFVKFYFFTQNAKVVSIVADPDPLVKDMDPDPDPSIIKQK